ncbi:MAG: nucleotide pyrophosphohydrolase [Promethearchaeia archaeon]
MSEKKRIKFKFDKDTSMSFFKKRVRKFVDERGWNEYHNPKNLIQAMQIEAAELSELFLFNEKNYEEIINDKHLMEDISDEVADVFIYLISFVNSLDIDLTRAFLQKMKKNKEKYDLEEFNEGKYYKK